MAKDTEVAMDCIDEGLLQMQNSLKIDSAYTIFAMLVYSIM